MSLLLIYYNLYVPPPFSLRTIPPSSPNSGLGRSPSLRIVRKDDNNDYDLTDKPG